MNNMVNEPSQAWLNNDLFANGPSGKSRGVFALLSFFLGVWGIQYFYVGKNTAGIICLLLTMFTCVGSVFIEVACLVQTIMVVLSNNQAFEQKYVNSTSTFPL